ncbi:unnamed protein product [Haemonchus placei]|uniref:Uncharacterized protein n=1 Tax=Haemonchus placei TaxID=6290 RepID=A0A3P7THR2_HAEPC|nr:unnamed protein product [Haemonchus placei]
MEPCASGTGSDVSIAETSSVETSERIFVDSAATQPLSTSSVDSRRDDILLVSSATRLSN